MEEKRKPKAVEVYLQALEKMYSPAVTAAQLYWWQKLSEKELIQTMQSFCWDNSIDFNTVNWGKFLRGEYVPDSWQREE